ncbi:MAG: hypothetical protein MK085_11165 [Phycisphaerales bacterium]|nr:hypothetical protein [Phycisphaerales bacterium]
MLRPILGVFFGFFILSAMASTTIEASAEAVGPDRLENSLTGEMSSWFIVVVEWPVSIISAIVGGVVAALVAGKVERASAIRALAMVILIFGFFSAAYQLYADKVAGSDAEVVEAELAGPVENAAEIAAAAEEVEEKTGTDQVVLEELPNKPLWDAVALPVVGAVGVLLGGRLVSNRRTIAMDEAKQG